MHLTDNAIIVSFPRPLIPPNCRIQIQATISSKMDPVYSPTDHINGFLGRLHANDPQFTEIHLVEEPGRSTLPPSVDVNEVVLQGIKDALWNNTCVTKLIIRDLPQAINDRGVFALYYILLNNPHITDVLIENVRFEGQLVGLRQIFSAIARNPHSAVRNLTVASAHFLEYEEENDEMHNDPTALFYTDAEALADLLRSTTTLRKINLSPNGLCDRLVTSLLAPALAENSSVTEVNVSLNHDLTETGLHALRNAMGGRGTVIMDCIDQENARGRDIVHIIPNDEY